jgi:Fibronectin type III domain
MATVSLASTANTLGPRRPGVTPLGIALVVQKRGTQTRGFELERVSRQLRDLNVYVVTITLNSQASRAKWSSALHHALQRAKHAVGDDSVPFIVGGLGDAASLAVELGVAHNAAGIVSFNSYALSIAWSLRHRETTTLLLSTLSAPIWLRSDNALASRIIGETSRHRSIDGTSGQLERELRKFLTASASQWPEELRSRASALAAKTAFAMAMVGGGSTLLAVAKAGAVQRQGDGITAPVAQMSDQPSARKLVGGFAISHRQRLGDSRLRAANVIGTPTFQHGAGYEATRTATTSTVGTTSSHITTPKQTTHTTSHPNVPGPGFTTHTISTSSTWTTTYTATSFPITTGSGGTTYINGPGVAVHNKYKTPSHFHATSQTVPHTNVHTVVQATAATVVNHRTHVHYPNRPKLVTNVTVTPGDSQATVSWTNPSSNGDPADHYIVEYSSDGGTNWSLPLSTQSGSDSSLTVTSLVNGTPYLFRVTAIDASANASSAVSATSAATPEPTTPAAPTGVTVTPGDSQATVSWTNPSSNGDPTAHNEVQYSTDGTNWTTASASISPSATRYKVTGLNNGTAYYFRVIALDGSANASTPDVTLAQVTPEPTLPAAPTNVTITPGNSQVTVSWTNPSSNGDPAVAYLVEYSSDGGITWSTPLRTLSGSDSSLTVTGLASGTSYLFRVAAVDARGASSPWAQTQSPITWSGGAGSTQRAPSAPIHVSAEVKGTQITVRWNAPNSSGSSPITHYTVSFSPGGRRYSVTGRTWLNRVRGFRRNKRYTITIYASNAAGDSPIAVLHNVRG